MNLPEKTESLTSNLHSGEEELESKQSSQNCELASQLSAEKLKNGTIIDSDSSLSLKIVTFVKNDSQGNFYQACIEKENQEVGVREALSRTEAANRLKREYQALNEIDSCLFPKVIDLFERDEKTYLVTEAIASEPRLFTHICETQKDSLALIPILARLAEAIHLLHEKGWAHLGLRPEQIMVEPTITIIDNSYITALGEKPFCAFFHAGYSSPELNFKKVVTRQQDIYSLGAILYRAITEKIIPEAGLELNCLPEIAGLKQILFNCLDYQNPHYNTMAQLQQDLLSLKQPLSSKVSYSTAGATTIGLNSTRTTNQDSYGYLSGKFTCESQEGSWSVACLADGMGGMAAGEIASEIAVREILASASSFFGNLDPFKIEQQEILVKEWVGFANQKVCTEMEKRRVKGGCAIVCICAMDDRLTLGHVGDCRIYLLRAENEPRLLTRDHSLSMALVLQNEISISEIRDHRDRSKLTRTLGERHPIPEYWIDTLEQTTPNSEKILELQDKDILLLCSDGLWEPILESDLQKLSNQYGEDLNQFANCLLQMALDRKTSDNATVVLLRVEKTNTPYLSK